MFLKKSDKVRHGNLITDLQDGDYVGRDEYPTTLIGAYDLMIRRSGAFSTRLHNDNGGRFRSDRGCFGRGGADCGGRGSNFTQLQGRERDATEKEKFPDDITLTPGVDGSTIKMECWACDNWGHSSYNCPNKHGRNGSSSVQFSMMFSQKDGFGIPDS